MDRDERKRADVELRWGVGHLLRAGVAASAVLLVAGLALAYASHDSARAVMRAGVFIMICTPPARVAALAAGYAKRRDWPFFWISLGVLALLALGMTLGAKH